MRLGAIPSSAAVTGPATSTETFNVTEAQPQNTGGFASADHTPAVPEFGEQEIGHGAEIAQPAANFAVINSATSAAGFAGLLVAAPLNGLAFQVASALAVSVPPVAGLSAVDHVFQAWARSNSPSNPAWASTLLVEQWLLALSTSDNLDPLDGKALMPPRQWSKTPLLAGAGWTSIMPRWETMQTGPRRTNRDRPRDSDSPPQDSPDPSAGFTRVLRGSSWDRRLSRR